jgi:hypothetical protein
MDADVMVGFGGKQAGWRSATATRARLDALGLRDLGDVRWRDGIDSRTSPTTGWRVTPPLPGARDTRWVLAVGRCVCVRTCRRRAGSVRTLDTEVQFFATHRVTELHRWQRAADGSTGRAFGYVGQTGESPPGTATRIRPSATPVCPASSTRRPPCWSPSATCSGSPCLEHRSHHADGRRAGPLRIGGRLREAPCAST